MLLNDGNMELQHTNKHSSTNIIVHHNGFAEQNASSPKNGSVSSSNYSLQQIPNSDSITVLLDFIYVLDEFGVPMLLILGVISNLIVSITIRNSELKKVSACCFFFAIGIVDILYLIAMAVPWISIRLVDIYNTEGFCQLVYYLNLLTTFLSSWYIVMLLVERLYVCYRPDTAYKYMNAFRTKCYITVVSIFSVVGHLYLTWTSGLHTHNGTKICMVILEHAKDIMVMRKVDTVFSFILPVTLCLLLPVPLIIYLCASNLKCSDGTLKVRSRLLTLEVRLNSKNMTRLSQGPRCSNAANDDKIQKLKLHRFSQSKRLTLVSVLIALMYALLFIPHSIIKSRVTFLNGDYIVTFEDSLFLKLFEELFKINFVYKAVVYFTFLPAIRRQFIKVFMPRCKRKRDKEQEQKSLETEL